MDNTILFSVVFVIAVGVITMMKLFKKKLLKIFGVPVYDDDFYHISSVCEGMYNRWETQVSPTGDYIDYWLMEWNVDTLELRYGNWPHDRYVVITEDEKLDGLISTGQRKYIYRLPNGYPETYANQSEWANKIRQDFCTSRKDGWHRSTNSLMRFKMNKHSVIRYDSDYTVFELDNVARPKKDSELIKRNVISNKFIIKSNILDDVKNYAGRRFIENFEEISKHKYTLISSNKIRAVDNSYLVYDNKYVFELCNFVVSNLSELDFYLELMQTVYNVMNKKDLIYTTDSAKTPIDVYTFTERTTENVFELNNVYACSFDLKPQYKNKERVNYTIEFDRYDRFRTAMGRSGMDVDCEFFYNHLVPKLVGFKAYTYDKGHGNRTMFGVIDTTVSGFNINPIMASNEMVGFAIYRFYNKFIIKNKSTNLYHHTAKDTEYGYIDFISTNSNFDGRSERFAFNIRDGKGIELLILPDNIIKE